MVTMKPPTKYIPWDQREAWASRVNYCYSIWRGERDLLYLLPLAEQFEIDEEELIQDINSMELFNRQRTTLGHRILTDKHRAYPNRSQVLKDVALTTIKVGRAATRRYEGYIQQMKNKGVVFGVNFDSIKGYVEHMRS